MGNMCHTLKIIWKALALPFRLVVAPWAPNKFAGLIFVVFLIVLMLCQSHWHQEEGPQKRMSKNRLGIKARSMSLRLHCAGPRVELVISFQAMCFGVFSVCHQAAENLFTQPVKLFGLVCHVCGN